MRKRWRHRDAGVAWGKNFPQFRVVPGQGLLLLENASKDVQFGVKPGPT